MSDQNEDFINNKYIRISSDLIAYIIFGLMIIPLAWVVFFNQWLGSTTVGSPLAKNNFTAQYWVYLQPDNAEAKNYRVKGDIRREDGTYSLDKVYWANGGYSTFDDCPLQSNDGKYSSYGMCSSDELINGGEDNRQYSVRLDTKVLPKQIVGNK